MSEVFLLWHHYPDVPGDDNAKLLGVYSSKKLAEQQIETFYKSLPGFRTSNGEFTVDKYEVDKNHWAEGFFRTDEAEDDASR